MLAKLTTLAALLSGFLLTGCATGTFATNGPTDSACKSFKPISASKADTEPTKRQVIGHNKAFDAICPDRSEKRVAAAGWP